MSGNARQRKQARDHREQLERRQRADIEASAAELEALRVHHAGELASQRAGYEQQLAEVQQRYTADVESWARAARTDADTIDSLRSRLVAANAQAERLHSQLDEIKASGLISRSEHEAGVEAATARLRERLRRKSDERLAPKKVVLEHVARDGVGS